MVYTDFRRGAPLIQALSGSSDSLEELRAVFLLTDILAQPLLERIFERRRYGGRRGYPLIILWRALIGMYYLEGVDSLNGVIRRLYDDPNFRALCGFGDKIPHRTTFLRFFHRVKSYQPEVDAIFLEVLSRLQAELPDIGREVAIDSTTVRVHANPNRTVSSDPEAAWTRKNNATAKDGGTEWFYGYKMHLLADTLYGVPLTWEVTPANRHDSRVFRILLEKAFRDIEWFSPETLTADRGYDYPALHEYLLERGITPIIHMRKSSASDGPHDGVYDKRGRPVCMGNISMEYIATDTERGHLYRCRGCHLKKRKGVLYCYDELWVRPEENPRVVGVVARGSAEWTDLYAKREVIEQLFKGMKQSRKLERHYLRRKMNIDLHVTMCTLTCVLKMLMNARAGRMDTLRWMVRKVA